MKHKNKLSVCMMVKNEERYLEDVLKSIQPFYEKFNTELIIVDTGSEDNTVEIAKKYTDKVYFHQWNNDFGSMRNRTIEYATGEWVLILDGDEIFEGIEPLIKFLDSSKSRDYNAVSIGIRNVSSKKNDEKSQPLGNVLRLFRNTDDFKYEGAIHEQPRFKKPVYFSTAEVIHYGYDYMDEKLMEYKFRRNIELLKRELEKDPDNIYILFQLSQSYGMYNKNKIALDIILRAYELVKKQKNNRINYLNVYNQLIKLYFMNEKYKELESTCKEALDLVEFVDFYYYLAISQRVLNKIQESAESFNKYLNLLKESNISSKDLFLVKDTLDFYENAYMNMAIIYKELKEYKKALEYIQKVTKSSLQEQKVAFLVDIYLELERYDELKAEYNKILKKSNNENSIRMFWFTLENFKKEKALEEDIELVKLVTLYDDDYSLLNTVRIEIIKKAISKDKSLISRLKRLEYDKLPDFFGDGIYYLLLVGMPQIGDLVCNVKLDHLNAYIRYLITKYDEEFKKISMKYLLNIDESTSFGEIRFKKELMKELLTNDLIGHNEYKEVFNSYVSNGIDYIKYIYNDKILEDETIYDMKNDEEIFMNYMYKAQKNKEENKKNYIRYLRKALKSYTAMKKGIEFLVKEFEEGSIPSKNFPDEFGILKENIKLNISALLETGKYVEAKNIIDEYLKIVPDDLEMLSIKSDVLLKV